jgi:uncharacterized protein YjbI with pentapeptide repeats
VAESDTELKEIPASEILDKIQKGERVEYDHVRVIGDLSIDELVLPTKPVDRTEDQRKLQERSEECKVISASIKITNSTFIGYVYFRSILFEGSIYFENTTFSGNADFIGSTFKRNAYFRKATFRGHVYFRGITFSNGAIFDGVTFSGHVFLGQALFSMDAEFKEATFGNCTDFIGTTFSEGGNFNGATFNEDTNFSRTNFKSAYFIGTSFGIVNFSKATINLVNFSEATFSGVGSYSSNDIFHSGANFSESIFKYAYFKGATFCGDVDFSEARINFAIFRKATFNRMVLFNEAIIREGYFDGAIFEGDIYFIGVAFEGEVLTFKNAVFNKRKSQEEACRRAKNVLAKAGNRDEEEYHFYREMEAKRQQKPWYIRYPESVFIQQIFGYGVHPWWLMLWWGIIIIVFGITYYIGNEVNGTTGLFQCMTISFATAIAPGYTASIIQPIQSGGTGFHFTAIYKVVAMAETIVGTFLWAGFIATFAKRYMR